VIIKITSIIVYKMIPDHHDLEHVYQYDTTPKAMLEHTFPPYVPDARKYYPPLVRSWFSNSNGVSFVSTVLALVGATGVGEAVALAPSLSASHPHL